MAYWLIKSEPETFSIERLEGEGRAPWDGIRNYQARNFMRDDMRVGDEALFYHSSCAVPAVVGIARVVCQPYPDPTQFDQRSPYFDPKSSKEAPRWQLVDIEFVRQTRRPISLAELRTAPGLENFRLVQRGNRLSIMPVTPAEWRSVLKLEKL